MILPEFRGFPSISRLFRDVVITEKIDGTNACIYVPQEAEEPLIAGSRHRWLGEGVPDNFGFARWVADNAECLRQLGHGTHFGEWWGKGIQRGYGLSEKRFSLFNVSKWGASRPACCYVVPVLRTVNFDTYEILETLAELSHHGSVAAPGFMKPEGVVVFHTSSNQLFKVTIEGDAKGKSA